MEELPPSGDTDPGAALLERVAEWDRLLTMAFVGRAAAVAAVFSYARETGRSETAVWELAGTLRLSQRSADGVLSRALDLADAPLVAEAMVDGRLGQCHGLALLDALSRIPAAVASTVAAEVLGRVDQLPPARVRELACRLVMRVDPAAAARRRKEAVPGRTFVVSPAPDGMAWVRILLQAQTAIRIAHRAEQANQAAIGDGRSADQRRADWVAHTLLGQPTPGLSPSDETSAGAAVPPPMDKRRGRPTQVLVHVPVAVALGLSDEPAVLAEYGPIDADCAPYCWLEPNCARSASMRSPATCSPSRTPWSVRSLTRTGSAPWVPVGTRRPRPTRRRFGRRWSPW